MKGLLLLAAVLVVVWLWKSRSAPAKPDRAARATEPQPQDMVRCHRCGLHLPKADALVGRQGNYCCAEHLHLSES
ncbi:hypothetical protein HUU62_15165 [Rhodoferax sp. 4810]|nr:hypothetical protein [Rhodoferax jenense]